MPSLTDFVVTLKNKTDHPSLDIVSSHGSELASKRIILCISGSVAAYKAIELARLLMRHGADVRCVASGAATRLIKPEYFRWATGNRVITKLTGDLEHIKLADFGAADMIIVYPATANTLGKLANGIDDTPVSTVLTVGFGAKIPILMCLAMHRSMYQNAAVLKNIEFLKDKIHFVDPTITEGKAKAPEPEDILDYILRRFGASKILSGKRVLITAGPTVEYIDPVRVITNQSTGMTGVLLASEFVSAGAKVTMIYGPGTQAPPEGAKIIRVDTTDQMSKAVRDQMKKRHDIVVMAAAAADYTVTKSRTKIKSDNDTVRIQLKRIPKIIDQIRRMQKDVMLVGFKAESGVSDAELVRRARKKLADSGADLVVANDIGTPAYRKDPSRNRVAMVDPDRVVWSGRVPKKRIAGLICKEIERRLARSDRTV